MGQNVSLLISGIEIIIDLQFLIFCTLMIFIYNLYVEHIYASVKVDIYESSHRILGIFPKLITLILTLCALILAVNIGSG